MPISDTDYEVRAGQLGIRVTDFLDDSANPGNRTINRLRGKSAIAAAATTATITNSKCFANSQVLCTVETVDGTLRSVVATPSAGSFLLTGNAAATGAVTISWTLINP